MNALVCLSVRLSVSLSVRASVCLSICLSVRHTYLTPLAIVRLSRKFQDILVLITGESGQYGLDRPKKIRVTGVNGTVKKGPIWPIFANSSQGFHPIIIKLGYNVQN